MRGDVVRRYEKDDAHGGERWSAQSAGVGNGQVESERRCAEQGREERGERGDQGRKRSRGVAPVPVRVWDLEDRREKREKYREAAARSQGWERKKAKGVLGLRLGLALGRTWP